MTTPDKKPAPGSSRKNRDQESLYKPGQLSRWFAFTSLILVVSWVVMLWKDYDRAWKGYQKDFYRTMLSVEEVETNSARTAITGSEAVAAAKDEVDRLESQYRADGTFAKLAALAEELHAAKKDAVAADNAFKSVKGEHAVAKYQFEMARLGRDALAKQATPGEDASADLEAAIEDTQAKRERFNYLADQWQKKLGASATADVKVLALRREIADTERDLTEAQRAYDAARSDADKQVVKLTGLQQKYANNQWRNAPFVDFISPTIKIEQVVLDDIHDEWNFATSRKVDRCMTCHVGIGMPAFADPAIVDNPKFDVKRYMRAHPQLELIMGPTSPHKVADVGCTVCHHGVGWAVDFARCTHTPADAEQREQWQDEHDWYKAKYIDYPMLPIEYVQGMCHKCHKEGMFEPVQYDERLDHGLVADTASSDLSVVTFAQRTLTNDPADPQFSDPANAVLPPGRVFGDWKLPAAPKPVDGSDLQIAAETRRRLRYDDEGEELPIPRDDTVHSWDWSPAKYWLGYDTAVTYGCQGCHKIQDFGQQVGYDAPPRVAPDLTYIADKVKPEWIPLWIKHPDAYRADTKMPSFYYFMQKDSHWEFLRGDDGKRLAPLAVMDAHLTDPNPDADVNLGDIVGVISTPRDHERFAVEILALSQYLQNQRNPETGNTWSRADPTDPGFSALYLNEPPPGDAGRGRTLVNAVGCTACHVVPEIETRGGEYVPDVYAQADDGTITSPYGAYRFDFDPLLMRGPRLTSLGSKIKDRTWLNAWLANPRHYTGHTKMPNMRLDDQERADVIDYLLSFRDEAFEAMEAPGFKAAYIPIVQDMYQEFFSKDEGGNLKHPRAVSGEVGDLTNQDRLATVLSMVGERLMMRGGCFGCHAVAGHQYDMPIGTELTTEGIKDLHQLDFGRIPKYVKTADGEKKDVVPHTRHDFFRTKVTYPRIWDYSKQLRWTDKLRMPRFNLRMDDNLPKPRLDVPLTELDPDDPSHYEERSTRAAVVGIVLGLVKEPIKSDALFDPDPYQADVIAGRRVARRYGCNNCHTLEGRRGRLWGWKVDTLGADPGTLPPNLFAQGWRTRDEWLTRFLQKPEFLRPIVQVHMPEFGLSDEEALALVHYFKRLGGRDRGMGTYNPGSSVAGQGYDRSVRIQTKDGAITVDSPVDEAKALFNTINCNKCHLPPEHPLAGDDGGVAPSFDLSSDRLRHQWVRMLLNDPGHLIDGTKMPQPYPPRRKGGRDVADDYAVYQFHLRDDPEWQALMASDDPDEKAEAATRLAELQMDMLTDYVLYHYEAPEAPSGEPPEEGK